MIKEFGTKLENTLSWFLSNTAWYVPRPAQNPEEKNQNERKHLKSIIQVLVIQHGGLDYKRKEKPLGKLLHVALLSLHVSLI